MQYAHALAVTATIAFAVVALLALCMTKPRTQALLRFAFWGVFCVLFGVVMTLAILSIYGER